MSKPRATNFPRWIKRTGRKINTLCRSVLNFRRSKTYSVRLKDGKRKNILTTISRNLFLGSKYGQRRRLLSRGFILPTITMIMLVFSLVVSSMLLRTSQSTQATIGSRESDVTYNLATPAVERAKAKIEFLFKRDYRYPNSIPAEETLERLMLNQRLSEQTQTDRVDPYMTAIIVNGIETGEVYEDIYKLPDESRIDINNDDVVDNAWAFDTDIDGDGNPETVAYSILMTTSRGNISVKSSTDSVKAENRVTRTGPLTLLSGRSTADCSIGAQEQNGWYPINTATVRKNFQVNAVVVKKNEAIRTVSSIEFQQDRQVDLGNKWAVWFRYDLEAYPGPDFNMNGAMHTEGNIIWGDSSGGEGINSYLISSPASCLYTEDASEITLSQVENRGGNITFQGQVLNGNPTPDNYLGQSTVDIYPGSAVAPTGENLAVILKKETDSITDSLQTNSPYQFSLDPISVFTTDVSASRFSNPTNQSVRDTDWDESTLHKRLFNKLIRRPYVDDTYRADDRWGPKPTYTNTIAVPDGEYGSAITGRYSDELTKENAPSSFPDLVGLDGYWERRARVQGLRIITGQRLELGNAFGWKESNDSLYPPDPTLTNLDRQRRSLRDNLAGVQSTLLYHYENDEDFPIATLATTVHPGTGTTNIPSTPNTRDQATTFKRTPYATATTNPPGFVDTDFLTGVGTNGWEFNAPGNATNQTAFATQIDDTTQPLRIALDNLAHFAGDQNGGFPPQRTTVTHPYPVLNMWGDFSELRRALSLITNTNTYADLSIADRTTIQTAAATVGLLAYDIDNVNKIYQRLKVDTTAGMEALGAYFWTLMDGVSTLSNLEAAPIPAASTYNRTGDRNGNSIPDSIELYSSLIPDHYLSVFSNIPSLPTATKKEWIAKARNLMLYAQVKRDRFLGFQKGAVLTSGISAWSTTFTNGEDDDDIDLTNNDDGIVKIEQTLGNVTNLVSFKTACDPASFISVDLTSPTILPTPNLATLTKKRKAIALATAFCSNHLDAMTPKYPSLYYLFPEFEHNYIDNQPTTEPYIADPNIAQSYAAGNHLFKVLNTNADRGISTIALKPRALVDWKIPKTSSTTESALAGTSGDLINKIVFSDINNTNQTFVRIPFLDKAFYDGRQLMQVRSLDIDLKMLRNNSVNTDTWLTKSGIIYAFREDAIREDAIARPTGTTFANCDTAAELFTDACRMKVNTPQDPPNNDSTGVSMKPIDFYPDPDRRPHGFRLRNGVDISRSGTVFGISFISDNPIYIQGDLNLHQNSSNNLLEEFTQPLSDSWDNFYTRSTRNTNFAKASTDRWRPVEILGDALTVLSKGFCDGTFENGMRNNNGDCPSGRTSSYRNSTLAATGSSDWKRENPDELYDPNDDSPNSPILVNRNAQIFPGGGTTAFTNYRTLSSGKDKNDATDTSMNAMFINGLVPSRRYQSYGGLHNFPRFIEDWGDEDLKIFGAFIQLKFSTYATAPWDQEAWEPGEPAVSGESIPFYNPPNRKWGYDVALQYAPPGPVASRFVSVGSPRNEFYEQLSTDDPYTKQLRCARYNTNRIDPQATNCPT